MNSRVEINPAICGGRPIISGTRITVQTILEFLGAGDSIEEVLEAYPSLTRADVLAALQKCDPSSRVDCVSRVFRARR